MSTEWYIIPGYAERYAITKDGSIKNNITGRHLLQRINRGYLIVALKRPEAKVSTTARVHRLLALTFIPNPEGKLYVDHIDGNKLNNDLKNLRWVTAEENLYNPSTYPKYLEATKAAHTSDVYIEKSKHRPDIEARKRKIMCIETGEIWESINEAARCVGDSPGNIYAACHRTMAGIKKRETKSGRKIKHYTFV